MTRTKFPDNSPDDADFAREDIPVRMPAVAELREREFVVSAEKGGGPRRHRVWLITWRGAAGRFSSGSWYRSKDDAVQMAASCGAQEIEFPKEEVAA